MESKAGIFIGIIVLCAIVAIGNTETVKGSIHLNSGVFEKVISQFAHSHNPYLTSVSSTPFQEPYVTVYVEQCLYLQCCARPPPLYITTNYKIKIMDKLLVSGYNEELFFYHISTIKSEMSLT
jgi:hypothetical protein